MSKKLSSDVMSIKTTHTEDKQMTRVQKFDCPSFPNYTEDMYYGNEPTGTGRRLSSGKITDRWETAYGHGETVDDDIIHFVFNVTHKITVYLMGDTLNIVDNRYSGKTDEWIYCNHPEKGRVFGCAETLIHHLEPEKVEKILNTEIPDCKIWRMIQLKSKSLYRESLEDMT